MGFWKAVEIMQSLQVFAVLLVSIVMGGTVFDTSARSLTPWMGAAIPVAMALTNLWTWIKVERSDRCPVFETVI